MDTILDLQAAPTDPIERLVWLTGVEAKVATELEAERMRLAYEVRLERGFGALLDLGLYSKTRLLRWCRAENRRRGTSMRWGDGVDAKSHPHVTTGAAAVKSSGASHSV